MRGSKNNENHENHQNRENSQNNKDGQKRVPRQKKSIKDKDKKVRIKLMFISLIILFIILGAIGLFYNYIGKFNSSGTIGMKKDTDEPVNVLLAGLDIGDPNQKQNEDIKRTDTLMLVRFLPKDKKVTIVSIPRDTLIKVKNKNHKINEAYTIGKENTLKSVIKTMVGQDIDYVVKIDYEGFRSFIDAIGGVEMHIDRNMKYDDPGQNLHINFKKGETVNLDGKKAEEFFRWRKNNDGTGLEDGDIGRIKNQHLFINKVVEKCTSPSIILKANDILDILPKYIQTDMPTEQMLSYGMALTSLKPENINMYTLQGETKYIDKISYLIYDKKLNQNVLEALKDSGSSKETSNSDGASKENTIDITNKRKEAKIKVVNATKINGLAAKCAEKLKDKGYSDIQIGNTVGAEKSELRVNDSAIRDLIKNDLNISKVKSLDENEKQFDAVIVIGKDYEKFGEK